MPLLTFQDEFVPAVEQGIARIRRKRPPHGDLRSKRQTIRAFRKDGRDPKAGDVLYLYEKARTPEMRKLGEVRCRSVQRIDLRWSYGMAKSVRIGGSRWRGRAYLNRIAQADGFAWGGDLLFAIDEMHGLPFRGLLIRW
jgi:hypothetical protein